VATHDFFAKITEIFDFFAFPNFRKAAKFAASMIGAWLSLTTNRKVPTPSQMVT